jgi:glycosyltransferase involved in cell wall biosynthesis
VNNEGDLIASGTPLAPGVAPLAACSADPAQAGSAARIRLLHVITTLDPGGAENHLLSLITAADRTRFDISVIYLKGRGGLAPELERLGVPVQCVDVGRRYTPAGLLRLLRAIRQLRPDIVHTHLFRADLYGGIAARLAGVPAVVSTRHNDEDFLRHPLWRLLHRLISSCEDRIIAISDHVGRYTIEIGVDNPGKVQRIYYGLDPERFTRPQRPGMPGMDVGRALRAEFGVGPEHYLLGVVARLVPQKGHRYLLEALALAVPEEPSLRLLIAGQGPLREHLEAQARRLGLDRHVVFAGWRSDVANIMAALDLLVLPSLWEGFGLVLLEAMALQKPIVATRVSAIPEVVEDGVTGLLVPPADPAALAAAILRLARDRELGREMGRRGRLRLEERFTLDRMVRQTEQVYLSLVSAGQQPASRKPFPSP